MQGAAIPQRRRRVDPRAALLQLSLVGPCGVERIVARVPSWTWMERLSGKMRVEVGSIAATGKAPRTGAEVKRWGIPHTTTRAIALACREDCPPTRSRSPRAGWRRR